MSRFFEIDDGRGEDRWSGAPSHDATAPPVRHVEALARSPAPRVRATTLPARLFSLPRGPQRETVRGRDRSYRLRHTESDILTAAGVFRVVFERDLPETRDRDDPSRLAQDVRHLVRQGLLERHTLMTDPRGHAAAVLSLTRDGQQLLERHRVIDEGERHGVAQAVSSGWRKVTEIVHDASLFRMYQVEAARIQAEGGVIQRIVLGDDLKRACYARGTLHDEASSETRQAARGRAAADLELPVVDGHLQFPDVRIEYDTAAGYRTRVDLELVTDAYRPGQIAAKHRAGFTLYHAGGAARHAIASLGGHAGLPPRAGAAHKPSWSSLLSL